MHGRAVLDRRPGRHRVRFAMKPNDRREFFNLSDEISEETIHESWRETRHVVLVNGQEGPADARGDFAIGKPFSSDLEWSVPAGPFNGKIELCSPVRCNLASCDRRAATISLRVDFRSGADFVPSGAVADVVGTWKWFVSGDVTFSPEGMLTRGDLRGNCTMSGSTLKAARKRGSFDTLALSGDGRRRDGFGSRVRGATSGGTVRGRRKWPRPGPGPADPLPVLCLGAPRPGGCALRDRPGGSWLTRRGSAGPRRATGRFPFA